MATRIRRGRRQLDGAGVAALTGASTAAIDHWHHHRASTGFPDIADADGDGRQWWWRTEIEAFHTAHLASRACFQRVVWAPPLQLVRAPRLVIDSDAAMGAPG